MELYFLPGACSLAPHILLEEVGAKYKNFKVDAKTKKLENGDDFLKINPKGQVPTLRTDQGQILTEAAVVLQYIADQHGDKNLLPQWGTWERYKANEWLNYISSEIHKGLGVFFALDRLFAQPEPKDEFRKSWTGMLGKKFDFLSGHLKTNQFLVGNRFSAADAYLFTVLNWHGWLKIDLTPWPELMGYMERIKTRPSVQAAMKSEGIL